jgi:branched-subunit amino acid aminotransferase/4-amino-4-deoxychorismate lyase
MHRIFVDGIEDGRIAADDPGLLLGMTIFETMRTYDGAPFRMDSHLRRLDHSARIMGIELNSVAGLKTSIESVLGKCNPVDDVRIRVTITAGGSRVIDVKTLDFEKVGAFIRVGKLQWDPPNYLPGVIKHGSRASWVVASRHQGVPEVLLVDSAGCILEASRSNVFAVMDGVIVTPKPDSRFLEGVTRGSLIEAASNAGITVRETTLPFDSTYEEFYLSSTLKQLAPVVEIAGDKAPGGGPLGASLRSAFLELVKREHPG